MAEQEQGLECKSLQGKELRILSGQNTRQIRHHFCALVTFSAGNSNPPSADRYRNPKSEMWNPSRAAAQAISAFFLSFVRQPGRICAKASHGDPAAGGLAAQPFHGRRIPMQGIVSSYLKRPAVLHIFYGTPQWAGCLIGESRRGEVNGPPCFSFFCKPAR
jgi:hypothetical protein